MRLLNVYSQLLSVG